MKKLFYLLLTLTLVVGLTACGGSKDSGSGDFTWTREGLFSDEDGNYLMVFPAEEEGYEGMWAVTAMMGDEIHGFYIPQEGETLHGNLDTEYDDYEGDYIVTISEEGNDGLMMEVEGGDTYHFVKEVTPDVIATLRINTDGVGEIAYGLADEEVEFDDEHPYQSTVVNLTEPQTYVIKARAEEGWKFVKWTKDGEDFSTESVITVDVAEDVEYIAVFEAE
ncbi:MAG: hypothetical protein E7230_05225 [Clostridiales bacterium]|nr:hypothetical protein [Clostridiales bacterium]